MARKSARKTTRPVGPGAGTSLADVLRWLERRGTKKRIAELDRYGITATRPYGVSVGDLKRYGKTLGADHELALGLWGTGRYEARLLAAFVDDPARVTAAQMNAWAADFDSWALVDTVCFHLFDRTPHRWKKVAPWARARPEFKKRAAFALLWSLSVHDKEATDEAFLRSLPLVERAATDEREYVKKGVDMALRAVGKRSRALNEAAIATARGLAESDLPAPRWIGRHALRELESPAVRKRLASSGR